MPSCVVTVFTLSPHISPLDILEFSLDTGCKNSAQKLNLTLSWENAIGQAVVNQLRYSGNYLGSESSTVQVNHPLLAGGPDRDGRWPSRVTGSSLQSVDR